jgi:hypothetical protein
LRGNGKRKESNKMNRERDRESRWEGSIHIVNNPAGKKDIS